MPDPHPFLVHFPVGLLVAGLLFDLTGTLLAHRELTRAGWWVQLCGTITLAAAIATGVLAGQRASLPSGASPVFEFHQQMAFLVAALFAGLLFWRMSTRTELPERSRVMFFLLYGGGVLALLIAAWAGGRLVYEYGVGVAMR